MEDWNLIKEYFPDIEDLDNDILEWHKEILDKRMEDIAKHPEKLRPIEELFEKLNREI